MRLPYFSILLAGACLPLVARAQSAPDSKPQPAQQVQAQPQPTAPEDEDADKKVDADKNHDSDKNEDADKKHELLDRANQKLKQTADEKRATQQIRSAEGNMAFGFGSGFPQPMEKAAWLGLSVSPTPPALRHQLRLPEGTGLVVDFVQPKSPGDEAGIKQYDLLEKLEDQILINPEQFAVLVRMYKPGDQVKLTLFREGKRDTLSVRLAERQLPRLPEPFFNYLSPNPVGPAPSVYPSPVTTSPRIVGESWKPDGAERSVMYDDGPTRVVITTADGRNVMTVTDMNDKKLLFSGPIDTPEQRKELPDRLRKQLERLRFKLPANDEVPGDEKNQKPQPPSPQVQER